ncbi:MAG: STN domain-containing protein, partial [Burkholderiaceae bacterium]
MNDHAAQRTRTACLRRLVATGGLLAASISAGCAQPLPTPSESHLKRDTASSGRHIDAAPASAGARDPAAGDAIPSLVNGAGTPPRPRNGPKLETYSVVVSQVEIGELLFAMARDAKLNLDVHPGLKGKVSINAIDQTLPQILNRLARQIPLRYELDGRNLVVGPDAPFVRHYTI